MSFREFVAGYAERLGGSKETLKSEADKISELQSGGELDESKVLMGKADGLCEIGSNRLQARANISVQEALAIERATLTVRLDRAVEVMFGRIGNGRFRSKTRNVEAPSRNGSVANALDLIW